MRKLIDCIANCYRKNYQFSEEKVQRIEYTLSAMWNEISKVLLYSMIFALLGKWKTFAVVYICLITIRLFAGGIHCGSYFCCLVFSFAFLSVCVYGPTIYDFDQPVLLFLSLFSILFTLAFAPMLPKVRSLKSRNQFWILKALATVSTFFWITVAFLFRKNKILSDNILWTVILANYQLIFPYWTYQKERRKKQWKIS